MRAVFILFALALGVVCINARTVAEDEENVEEANDNGKLGRGLVSGNEGLSRQKRSSHHRRKPIISSSSSSSSSEEQRHNRRNNRRGGRRQSGRGAGDVHGSNGPPKTGRQFFAPGVVPYGAPGLLAHPYGAAVYGKR